MINGETVSGFKIQLLKTDGEYIWSDRIFAELNAQNAISLSKSINGKNGKKMANATEKMANATDFSIKNGKSSFIKNSNGKPMANATEKMANAIKPMANAIHTNSYTNKDIYIDNCCCYSLDIIGDENNNNNNSFDINKIKQEIMEYFQEKSKYTILEEENIEFLAKKFILKYIEPKITNNQSLSKWQDEADLYILTSIKNSKAIDHTGKYDPEKIKLRKLLDKFPNPQNVIINGFVYNFNGEKMATYYHNDKHHTRYFKDVLELYLKEPNNYKLEIDGELINAS